VQPGGEETLVVRSSRHFLKREQHLVSQKAECLLWSELATDQRTW
jgi:hypothetical protein